MKTNKLIVKNKNSYRWRKISGEEIAKIKKSFKILSPKAKEYFEITPFISVVITQKCTLKCAYCCEGGEGTNSQKIEHNLSLLETRIREALEMGIKKIRITGGEPFLYPKFKDLIKIIKKLKKNYNFFLLINTNATIPIKNYIPLLKETNAKLAVHLDTVNKEEYAKISKSNENVFDTVIKNIKLLKKEKLLHRFNVVISKYNIKKLDKLIDFACKLKVDIKAFDITKVPNQFVDKTKIYSPLENFIKNLEKRKKEEFFHPYTLAFGTPVKVYNLGPILISVKYTKYGSRYSNEYCKNCPFFPCDEGLYDILYYPDDTLWGCRWYKNKALFKNNFKRDLKKLSDLYKNSKWFIGNKFVE